MGFKKMGCSLDFADFALSSSLEANRSVKFMTKPSGHGLQQLRRTTWMPGLGKFTLLNSETI